MTNSPRGAGLKRLAGAHFLLRAEYWFPVWVIFLLDRGFTLTEVVLADVVFRACIVAFEFPLGVAGDYLGRKRTYLTAAILGAVTYLVIPFIQTLTVLLLVWMIWAFFICTLSGTDSAYQYETIVGSGLRERATYLLGIFNAVAATSMLLSHVAAGFLYSAHPGLPFWINAGFCAAAALVILTLPNPKPRLPTSPSLRRIVAETFTACRRNAALRTAVLISALLMVYHWTTTLLFQPLLTELGISPGWVGVVYAGVSTAGILGGLWAGRGAELFGVRRSILVGSALLVAGTGLAGSGMAAVAVAALALMQFSFYAVEPVLKVALNRHCDDTSRASLLSFVSLMSSLMMMGSRPLVGMVSEWYSPRWGFLLWAGIGIVLLVGIGWLMSNRHSSSR